MPTIIEAMPGKKLADGRHEGTITAFDTHPHQFKDKTEPTIYGNWKIKEDVTGMELNYSMNLNWVEGGDLAIFLKDMGFKHKIGEKIDVEKLIGKKVAFTTTMQPNKNDLNGKKYATIVKGSIESL